MPKRSSDYRSSLLEDLKDPAEAANYLNAALGDSPEMFLCALRDVAEARQMARVAEGAGVSRESLYRMLKRSGNPTYRNFIGVLQAIGLEFAGVRTAALKRKPEPTGSKQRRRVKRKPV
jgi:probable addiction module antidote protein